MNPFEITRASVSYFPENVRGNFKFYEGENFSDSSIHASHFRIRKFKVSIFCEKKLNPGSEMQKIKLQKMVRNLLDKQ